jgi:hypothetical protein
VPKGDAAEGELMTIKRAAFALGVAPSTIHRLLNDGFIAGEQITPGAPWRIRLTDELKARFNAEAAAGFLPNARGDPRPRRLTTNGVAACQARRARSRPRYARPAKRTPHQGDSPARRAVRMSFMNQGTV